jgi:hypothetical protein
MPSEYVLIFDHIVGHFEWTFSNYDSAVASGKIRGVDEFSIEGSDGLCEHWVQGWDGEWGKEEENAE